MRAYESRISLQRQSGWAGLVVHRHHIRPMPSPADLNGGINTRYCACVYVSMARIARNTREP